MYTLPGTNHPLIQGYSSNDYFCQWKYIYTTIYNSTDINSDLDNISNPVTANDAYPDANFRCTPFIFISDTDSTTYVINTGANHIILNDLRQFKVFHSCNGNVKGIGGSNNSTRVTGTTYIPIKSNNGTVDYIKVPDAVFVPSSTFNLQPPHLFIPALWNTGHETDHSKHENIKYIFNYKLPSEGKDRWRKLAIRIGKQKLFTMRTSYVCTSLFKRASTYDY